MNSRDFAFWLQGLFEIADPKTLDEKQVALIKAHLNMVFIHEIDPSFPDEQQKALTEAHEAGKVGFQVKKQPQLPPAPGFKYNPNHDHTLIRC